MAFIFDVEGTLVDSVQHQLRCLHETLRLHGRVIPIATLQQFSGMDGNDMLERLAPDLDGLHQPAEASRQMAGR